VHPDVVRMSKPLSLNALTTAMLQTNLCGFSSFPRSEVSGFFGAQCNGDKVT